jgi:hypothetical protein
MKNRFPILALFVFLGLAFLGDYVLQVLLNSSAGVVPYLWLVTLCYVVFGAAFLGFLYLSLHMEWLTRSAAITCIVVAFLLLFTPIWVSIFNIPAVNNWAYTKFPNLIIPAIPSDSLFAFTAFLLVVTGVFALLPKPQKKKK